MKTPELTPADPAPGTDLAARLDAARRITAALGVDTSAVPPFNGLSKPIERLFRSFASKVRP